MQETVFDQKMNSFFERTRDRMAGLKVSAPVATACVAQVNTLLEASHSDFTAELDAAYKEGAEAKRAAGDLDRAEAACDVAFDAVYNTCQAQLFVLKNGPADAYKVYQLDYDLAFDGNSPAAFARLGIDRSVSRMQRVVRFAEQYFGADEPTVDAARKALDELERVRAVADKESGEYAEAMTRLIAARDKARRDYQAAREILGGVLRLEGSDDLNQLMPSLSAIYKPSRGPGLETDDTDTEDTDPEPVEA